MKTDGLFVIPATSSRIFGAAEWRIPETKNGKALTVHLPTAAMELLKARQQADGSSEWVFPDIGKTGHLVEPKSVWKRVLERAGLMDLRIHDLRRTLGSWQAAAGVSLTVIGKSLGHKNTATTASYARLNLDPVRAAVDTAVEAMLKAGRQGIASEANEPEVEAEGPRQG